MSSPDGAPLLHSKGMRGRGVAVGVACRGHHPTALPPRGSVRFHSATWVRTTAAVTGILAACYRPEGLQGSVAVPGRRRGDKAAHRADRSADRGTKRCTVPTGSGCPDRSPAASTDQAAPNRSLDRVVWIGASR